MEEDEKKPVEAEGSLRRNRRRGRLLLPREQEELIALLHHGVGRAAACRKLGFSYDSFLQTFEERPQFAFAVQIALAGIDQNVEMALYKSAMQGSVTAQTFWLKGRRPEGWDAIQGPQQKTSSKVAATSDRSPQFSDDNELAALSDRELIKRARAEGVDLPPEIASRLERAYRLSRSRDVSPAPDD